jgi:hypothetical protein
VGENVSEYVDTTGALPFVLLLVSLWVASGIENRQYKKTRTTVSIVFAFLAIIQTIIGQESKGTASKIAASCFFLVVNFALWQIRVPFDLIFQLISTYWVLSLPMDVIYLSLRACFVALLVRAMATNDDRAVIKEDEQTVYPSSLRPSTVSTNGKKPKPNKKKEPSSLKTVKKKRYTFDDFVAHEQVSISSTRNIDEVDMKMDELFERHS